MGDYHTSTTCTRPKIKIDNNSILIFDDLDRQCTSFFFQRKQSLIYVKEIYYFLARMNTFSATLSNAMYCFTSTDTIFKELIYYKLLIEGFQLLSEAFTNLAHSTMILYQMKSSTKIHFLFNHFKLIIAQSMTKFEDIWLSHGRLYALPALSAPGTTSHAGNNQNHENNNNAAGIPNMVNMNNNNNNNHNQPADNNPPNNNNNNQPPPANAPLAPGAPPPAPPAPVGNNVPSPSPPAPLSQYSDIIVNQITTDPFIINDMKTMIRDLKKRIKDYTVTIQSEIILEKDSSANSSCSGSSMGNATVPTLMASSILMRRGMNAANNNNLNNNNNRKNANKKLGSSNTGTNNGQSRNFHHHNHISHYHEIIQKIPWFNEEERDVLMNTFFGNAFGSSSQVYNYDLDRFFQFMS
jgi:hypothetical protein